MHENELNNVNSYTSFYDVLNKETSTLRARIPCRKVLLTHRQIYGTAHHYILSLAYRRASGIKNKKSGYITLQLGAHL